MRLETMYKFYWAADNITTMEVIFMDPLQFIPVAQPISSLQPIIGFAPGVFPNIKESDDFLSSLDSDTRDYVLKHTDEFRTRSDVIDCVNRLHGKS